MFANLLVLQKLEETGAMQELLGDEELGTLRPKLPESV
jgi:hypothetical protein